MKNSHNLELNVKTKIRKDLSPRISWCREFNWRGEALTFAILLAWVFREGGMMRARGEGRMVLEQMQRHFLELAVISPLLLRPLQQKCAPVRPLHLIYAARCSHHIAWENCTVAVQYTPAAAVNIIVELQNWSLVKITLCWKFATRLFVVIRRTNDQTKPEAYIFRVSERVM
jgi:hypothetical protein